MPRLIFVVTGANSGVGFGICCRLLVQLAQKSPLDALPQFTPSVPPEKLSELSWSPRDGCTLIMACRNRTKAEEARSRIYQHLQRFIENTRKQPEHDTYADVFLKNLSIDIQILDLGSIHSVFAFSRTLRESYPYVSHLIMNAGIACFTGIDWICATKQILTEPMVAFTMPVFNLQSSGDLSKDGLGYVWQCNVFGHYALYRNLQSHMSKTPADIGVPRVIWMSSMEALPGFFEWDDDIQLVKTAHSYQGSKYQIDLLATELDRRNLELHGDAPRIRHLITEPGMVTTNIQTSLVGPVLDFLKEIVFYIARFCGSVHHTIRPITSAVGAVHLCLVALAFVPTAFARSSSQGTKVDRPVRIGSQTDKWGNPRVGTTEVVGWDKETKINAGKLLDYHEKIYVRYREQEGWVSD